MRARRRAANTFYAIATIGVLAAVLALSLLVWWFRPATLDPKTLCPTNMPLRGHTVVIVDRTDRWSDSVGDALKGVIERAQRSTQQYQKFSIVSLDADQSVQPLFSICNPGEPTLLSDLYRGRRYTMRDFEDRFVGASERVVEVVSKPSQAAASPIIEYVHRWLGGDEFNTSVQGRRLVLISDMRQHSPTYSLYQSGAEGLAQVAAREFGPNAKGVKFDIYFVSNAGDSKLSENDVRAAWEQTFAALGVDHTWRQIN